MQDIHLHQQDSWPYSRSSILSEASQSRQHLEIYRFGFLQLAIVLKEQRNRRRSSEVKGDGAYHVSVDERGEIEIWGTIKLKLVMDQLVRAVGFNSIFRKLVFGDIFKGAIA